jgi:CDP-glucose 4,6-dehydratase
MLLALKLSSDVKKYSGAWNFGPHTTDNFSVADLANIAVDIWGTGKLTVRRDENAPHEARLLRLDISKVIEGLKWTPKMNAKQAIERTITWYKKFYAGANVQQLINDDINFYKTLF